MIHAMYFLIVFPPILAWVPICTGTVLSHIPFKKPNDLVFLVF